MRKKPQADSIAEHAARWQVTTGIRGFTARARAVLDAVLSEIAGELQRTGAVRLPGFGVFEVKERKGRAIRDPHGNPLVLPATKEIRFRPSRDLTERVTGRRPS